MYNYIKIERKNHIAVLTLNRPDKLNAIDLQVKREIHRALDELEADNDVRVVIMTGAGRAFSSGHDMNAPRSELPEFESLEEEERLLTFDKPIIAAIHGYALGDALQQAVLCDIIVAAEQTKLGFIGPRVGAICYGAVWLLRQIVGWKKASELLLTCDQISAEEAYRIGLVNKVVPHEQLMPTAIEIAEKIMKAAPLSIKYTKRLLRRGLFDADVKAAVHEATSVTIPSEDGKEAARAFKEKREPVFKGR